MKNVSIALFSAIALIFASCEKITGEGPVVTETRALTDFNGIDLRMFGEVYFTKSDAYKLEVSAQKNILDKLETSVSNNKLVIKFRNNLNIRSYDEVKIMVSGPDLTNLRVSGSGDIITTNAFTTSRLDLDVSGSGGITIAKTSASFADVTISG